MMLRRAAMFIVRCIDAIASIPHNAMLVEDWDPKEVSALAYGMSLMAGCLILVYGAFGAFLVLAAFIGLVVMYPIQSISIGLSIGLFILIGHLRHRLGGKQ